MSQSFGTPVNQNLIPEKAKKIRTREFSSHQHIFILEQPLCLTFRDAVSFDLRLPVQPC